MTEDDKKMAEIGAVLDHDAAVARDLGEKVEVSQMELSLLCTAARLGVLHELYFELNGTEAAALSEMLDLGHEAIQERFGSDGRDGLDRLIQGTVAVLEQERFLPYDATTASIGEPEEQ